MHVCGQEGPPCPPARILLLATSLTLAIVLANNLGFNICLLVFILLFCLLILHLQKTKTTRNIFKRGFHHLTNISCLSIKIKCGCPCHFRWSWSPASRVLEINYTPGSSITPNASSQNVFFFISAPMIELKFQFQFNTSDYYNTAWTIINKL